MQETKITNQNLLSLLLEEASRKRIFKKYNKESGQQLFYINHISDIASSIALSLEEAQALKKVLLGSGHTGRQIFKDFIAHPNFPEPILFELFEEKECLTALAHKKGPIDLLLKIARTTKGHEEALLTIGKQYYYDEEVSSKDFQNFLNEFGDSEWLLNSLIHTVRGKDQKATIFKDFIYEVASDNETIMLYQELEMEQELLVTTDKSLIKTKHKTKNPRFLRAIAQNTATPLKVLLSLKKINRVKYAGSIRNYAIETLAKIKAK